MEDLMRCFDSKQHQICYLMFFNLCFEPRLLSSGLINFHQAHRHLLIQTFHYLGTDLFKLCLALNLIIDLLGVLVPKVASKNGLSPCLVAALHLLFLVYYALLDCVDGDDLNHNLVAELKLHSLHCLILVASSQTTMQKFQFCCSRIEIGNQELLT